MWLKDWSKNRFLINLALISMVFGFLKHVLKLGQNLNLLVVAFGPIYMLVMGFWKNWKFWFVYESLKIIIKVHFLGNNQLTGYVFSNTQLTGNNFLWTLSPSQKISGFLWGFYAKDYLPITQHAGNFYHKLSVRKQILIDSWVCARQFLASTQSALKKIANNSLKLFSQL